MDPAIRASPYEAGLYFVSPEPGTTLQSIGTTEWKVGERYKLQKVLGYGSFSCVCLAIDTITGERVALKRIGDVLHSADQAKRVLREISILRRTTHPNLIGLRDCFLRPSATGQCRMINGRLVNCSIDLYIAMEFADGGDLFHMRGQLAPAEVTSLLWQLLQAVQYMHSLHIWHRDIKSQNAFIHWEKGVRVIKLGDFGSARSALLYDLDSENPVLQRDIRDSRVRSRSGRLLNMTSDQQQGERTEQQQANNGNQQQQQQHRRARFLSAAERSFKQMEEAMQTEDLYANLGASEGGDTDRESVGITADDDLSSDLTMTDNPGDGGQSQRKQLEKERNQERIKQNQNQGLVMTMAHSKSSHGRGYKAPLTRVVATPCYRAPEVVMSRGGYSSALDMWGIGCIFGELLQRVAYIGSASNPNLAVAPLFALRCFPKTPETGETFGRPECSGTRRELQALFDVVGTPSWRDAAAVEMEEWRHYLERLPGKAPTLYRRFKPAGEVAIHLLTRLLDFDPVGRAACEEALAHEFFAAIREELSLTEMIIPHGVSGVSLATAGGGGYNGSVGGSLGTGDAVMRQSTTTMEQAGVVVVAAGKDAEMDEESDGDGDVEIKDNDGTIQPPGPESLNIDMRVLSFDGTGLGETLSVDAAAAAATLEALHSAEILNLNRKDSDGVMVLGGGNDNNNTSTEDGGMLPEAPSSIPVTTTATGSGAEEAAAPPAAAAETENLNPGKALALLEEELEIISESAPGGLFDPSSEGHQRLRQLLEAEVAAAAASAAARTALRTSATITGASGTTMNTSITISVGGSVGRTPGRIAGGAGGGAPANIDMAALGRGASLDYGRERLSNVADTVQGRELDPNKFLGSKRHGEWTAQGGGGSVAPGPRWGVTSVPPGLNVNIDDPRVKEIIKKQQGR